MHEQGNAAVAMPSWREGRHGAKDDDDGRTALHCASINGHTETAMALIDRSRCEQQGHNMYDTPHSYACGDGHTEVVMALIDRGTDVASRMMMA
jgi:ankyrin repeat protein